MEKIPDIIPNLIDEHAVASHCKTYLVGGFLRDQIFNKPVSDIDVCVVGRASDLPIVADRLMRLVPKGDWDVEFTETYNDGKNKTAEWMYGVMKLIPKNINSSLPIDIIFVYSLAKYVASFPCNISKVWFELDAKTLHYSYLRPTLKNGVVRWNSYDETFSDYYKKIARKYHDYKFVVGGDRWPLV